MKTNSPNVALRLDKFDKAALVELARRLRMNQSQTIRILVRDSLAVLKEREVKGEPIARLMMVTASLPISSDDRTDTHAPPRSKS